MVQIIDSHTHVISSDGELYPVNPIGGHQSEWSLARPVDHENLVRALDDSGISQAVVVQASTVYGHDNRYVVEAVRAHPDRLVGVYSVDLLAPDAVAQITRWQNEGLFGFRLFTTGSTMPGQANWLDDPRAFPAWAHAEANAIPICLQMTLQGLPALRGMLERYPKAKVLLDHLARPDLSDGPPYAAAQSLLEMAAYPSVHLKLTGRTLAAASEGASTPKAFIPQIVAAFGAERIAWGSNFPAAKESLPELVRMAKAALSGLPTNQQATIFAGTAASLYPGLKATIDA